MTDVTKRVDAFLAEYGMDPARVDLDQCARAFQADMERGLRGDPEARMPMLPAYLAPEGDIPQDQPAIVIAGGTNFRIGLVSLGARGPEIQDLRVFPMPGSQGPITWEEFVDQVSEAVLPLTGRSRRVGLCFSYAAEILPNGDGRVLRFSKQVQVEGSEGKELGRDLSAVVVDGAKADGSMTTQVFTLEDGLLLNSPAGVNSESYQNPFSRPSAAVFTSQDVNGDGLLEIPVASQLPAIPEDVSLDSTGFLVEWVNADTSGNYETALTALMNLGENYWFRLPASLVGKISASNNTAARSVTYTEVVTGEDGSQLLGSPLFTIRVFTRSAWDSRGETSGYEQLAAQGDLVFGIQTLTQDAEHLRAIAQIRSQFHVTLE